MQLTYSRLIISDKSKKPETFQHVQRFWSIFCLRLHVWNENYLIKTISQMIEGRKKIRKYWTSISRKIFLYWNYKADPNNTLKKKNFRDYRAKTNRLIKIAKQKYYQNEIKNSVNNSKKFWEIVKNISVSDKDTKIGDIYLENGTITQIIKKKQIYLILFCKCRQKLSWENNKAANKGS